MDGEDNASAMARTTRPPRRGRRDGEDEDDASTTTTRGRGDGEDERRRTRRGRRGRRRPLPPPSKSSPSPYVFPSDVRDAYRHGTRTIDPPACVPPQPDDEDGDHPNASGAEDEYPGKGRDGEDGEDGEDDKCERAEEHEHDPLRSSAECEGVVFDCPPTTRSTHPLYSPRERAMTPTPTWDAYHYGTHPISTPHPTPFPN
jgi:hypothetical protein